MKGIYYRIITTDCIDISKRNSIQLLGLCKTSIFKSFGEDIMKYFGEEFNVIKRDGIICTMSGSTQKFDIEIAYFSLDSKEASYLIGLKQGFTHNFCCRFCTISRQDFKSYFFEDEALLRTPENYRLALNEALIDASSPSCFGIERNNLLRFFNCQDSFFKVPPCIDHDFYEGLAPKILKNIINRLLYKKLISNHHLNQRIKVLNLKGKDKYAFPTINLQNAKLRLTMNECLNLLRFLPYLLHDCFQPNDGLQQLLFMLCEISNSISSFSHTIDSIVYLKTLISDFLQLCQSELQDLNITIKLHHLIHYPRIILMFGPLKYLSTINFESQHSFLKSLIRSSKNWINPALTIATKYARFNCISNIQQNSYSIANTPFSVPIVIRNLIGENYGQIKSLNSLTMNGVKYCKNQVIWYRKVDEILFY